MKSVEQVYDRGYLAPRIRRYADQRLPQGISPDFLADIVDPEYLAVKDGRFRLEQNYGGPSDRVIRQGNQITGVEKADQGENFIDRFILEGKPGMLPTVVWQIDGDALKRRITTSRYVDGQEIHVRCIYEGSGRIFSLNHVQTRKTSEFDTLIDPIASSWSSPDTAVDLSLNPEKIEDLLKTNDGLELRINAETSLATVAVASGQFSVPVVWDYRNVG